MIAYKSVICLSGMQALSGSLRARLGACCLISCLMFSSCARSVPSSPNAPAPAVSELPDDEESDAAPLFSLDRGGARIDVVSSRHGASIGDKPLRPWVENAADSVIQYFGRFPVPSLRVLIVGSDLGKIHGGLAREGRFVRVQIGRDTTAADFSSDWVLIHEFFHLGFPQVDERYAWMQEGLSDYLEPLIRARRGNLKPSEVWSEFAENMPSGQPAPGDRGLDNTATWGRTYWGGTTFWLLADIQIRQRTNNHKSLDDVIGAILDAGGSQRAEWSLDRVIATADVATGTTVIRELHEQMGSKPLTVDLAALWKQLGVIDRNGAVTFDDSAPLASIRVAILSENKRR